MTAAYNPRDDWAREENQMTETLIYADEIRVGNKIIPPGRKRPVVVEMQMSAPESADYFEFACESTNGWCAVRMHRSEQAVLVGQRKD